MKNYKKELRREIDGIKFKSKKEMLVSAGVSDEALRRPRRARMIKRIPVIIAAVLLMSFCAMLALAEESNILVQIQNIFSPEENEEKEESAEIKKPVIIEKRKYWSEEFKVSVDYRHDPVDRSKDEIYYYRSAKDAIADMGENLYYPDYDTNYASIIYSTRGSGDDAYSTVQIGYYDDALHMFWIHEGTGHFGTGPEEKVYISNGNTFYIGDFNDGHVNGCLSWGVIDGNTYQLQTDTAENAKMIIDSLKPSE